MRTDHTLTVLPCSLLLGGEGGVTRSNQGWCDQFWPGVVWPVLTGGWCDQVWPGGGWCDQGGGGVTRSNQGWCDQFWPGVVWPVLTGGWCDQVWPGGGWCDQGGGGVTRSDQGDCDLLHQTRHLPHPFPSDQAPTPHQTTWPIPWCIWYHHHPPPTCGQSEWHTPVKT